MQSEQFELVDFHVHHVPPQIPLNPAAAAQPASWQKIRRLLADLPSLLDGINTGDVDGRVVSIPAEQFTAPGKIVSVETIRRVNDLNADIVGRHPGKLFGLATIDAFSGDTGAREVERARRDLGLLGIFIESARGDTLLDAAEAYPSLAAAAHFGMPVFVHPVNQQPYAQRMSRYGRLGDLFARGTVNAATLLALIQSGTPERLPDLHLIVTTLAIGGVLLATSLSESQSPLRGDALMQIRRHVYIDTMGFEPALLRVCADLLGADHVVLGSDWPIHNEPVRARANRALRLSGLGEREQRLIGAGNARRLLSRTAPEESLVENCE